MHDDNIVMKSDSEDIIKTQMQHKPLSKQRTKYYNMFYCPICADIVPHKLHINHMSDKIECSRCNDIKLCTITRTQNNVLIKIFPSTHLKNISELKCLKCGKDAIFKSAYFRCKLFVDMLGYKSKKTTYCLDLVRPLCDECHMIICTNFSHDMCKMGFSKL